MTQEQANWEWMDARVKFLEAYIADLEKGLESSLNLNKAQAERQEKMTTFTTEDRLIAEQNGSVTINVDPIPFSGLVTITETPKYKDLTDEEIYEIGDKFVDNSFDEQGYSEFDRIGFARAVIKKAQEK